MAAGDDFNTAMLKGGDEDDLRGGGERSVFFWLHRIWSIFVFVFVFLYTAIIYFVPVTYVSTPPSVSSFLIHTHDFVGHTHKKARP